MPEEPSPLALFRSFHRKQLVALILIFFGLLGLAIYGWISSAAQSDIRVAPLSLITYVCDTVFGKEYILLGNHPEFPNWAVQISTYGFKLLFILAIIKGGLVLFGRKLRLWWFENISKATGHTIICGAGHMGASLALKLLQNEPGKLVLLVDQDEENPSFEKLKNEGVFVITGNALDPEVFRKARPGSAGRIISLLPRDEMNVSVAAHSADEEKSTCEIIAAVESYELRSYFRKHARIRMISFLGRAARKLFSELACSIAIDPNVRERGACILLEASNPLREECLRAASVALQISGDVRPTVILPHSTEDDRKGFEERYPDAFRVLNLVWVVGDASKAIFEQKIQIPDIAIFGLDDDAKTLEAAERFRIRTGCGTCFECDGTDSKCEPCKGNGRAAAVERIVAVLKDSGELFKLAGNQTVCQIKTVNAFELSLGDGDPLDDSHEATAKKIHESYRAKELKKRGGYKPAPWESLPEMEKDDNRLAAGHESVKLAIWNSYGKVTDESMIEFLARSEHQRWMAVKIMDGWRWSGSSDQKSRRNPNMLHHLFIPFDELPDGPEGEKIKDINNVRLLLGLEEIS